MKRLFYIFIVCIITTLPTFGDNEPSMVTLRAQQIIPDGLSAQTFQTTESVSTPRQQAVEANFKKATTVPTKKPYPQTDEEQKRLVRTAFSKFCKDDGYVYKDNGAELPSIGVLDANCNAPGNGQLYFSCYKFKTNPAPAQEIHKHFAYYCYTNVTTPTKITTATRPSDHYNKKDAERAAKQEENKVGKRCEIENATSAKYVKKMSGKIVCEPDDCICGYEIVENNFQYSCKKWRQDKPSCYGHESMPDNATKAHYECNKNNKKICVVDECNYKTHYLDSDKNKCIAKSTVKCTQYEEVDDTGKCISKHDADRIKAERQASCNGTNGEWTDDDKCKCKKGYKPVKDDPYACEPTDKTATNEENKKLCEKDGAGKWTDKNKCECTDPTHSFVDGKGCEKDDKKADEEKQKNICENNGTKGKWNKTLNKCNCNEKNHIFDEEIGCTAATPKFIEAQKEIENLKSQLEATITELNK